MSGYESHWAALQGHDDQAQQTFARQSPDCAAVTAAVAAADGDLARIQGDGRPLAQLGDTITGDSGQVQADLGVVQQGLAELQQALAAVTGPRPRTLTTGEVDAALASAQNQITTSRVAVDTARARASEIEQNVAELDRRAHELADGCGT